jgi:hypothetical protein
MRWEPEKGRRAQIYSGSLRRPIRVTDRIIRGNLLLSLEFCGCSLRQVHL